MKVLSLIKILTPKLVETAALHGIKTTVGIGMPEKKSGEEF